MLKFQRRETLPCSASPFTLGFSEEVDDQKAQHILVRDVLHHVGLYNTPKFKRFRWPLHH